MVLGYGQSCDDGAGLPLFAVVGVSHSLASEEEVEPLPAVAISISAYFLLLQQMDEGGYAASSFEASGLYTAMLTALLATKLYAVLLKKNLKIENAGIRAELCFAPV